MFNYKVFRDLCFERNVSETAVGKAIGITRASITGWKKGSQPSQANIQKLAAYFSVEPAIFEKAEQPPATPAAPLQIVTEKELQLLALWRTLTDDEKTAVYTVAETFAARHAMEKRTVS